MTTRNLSRRYKTTKENFYARVLKPDGDQGCWNFPDKYIQPNGYARLCYQGRSISGHRLSFFFHHGRHSIALVLHSCDNRRCVNPAHLREGTYHDNARDALERKRQVRGERCFASKLTDEEVREARRLHSEGYAIRRLARIYGVAQSTMRDVIRCNSWRHVK